jgi:hypothetical protein
MGRALDRAERARAGHQVTRPRTSGTGAHCRTSRMSGAPSRPGAGRRTATADARWRADRPRAGCTREPAGSRCAGAVVGRNAGHRARRCRDPNAGKIRTLAAAPGGRAARRPPASLRVPGRCATGREPPARSTHHRTGSRTSDALAGARPLESGSLVALAGPVAGAQVPGTATGTAVAADRLPAAESREPGRSSCHPRNPGHQVADHGASHRAPATRWPAAKRSGSARWPQAARALPDRPDIAARVDEVDRRGVRGVIGGHLAKPVEYRSNSRRPHGGRRPAVARCSPASRDASHRTSARALASRTRSARTRGRSRCPGGPGTAAPPPTVRACPGRGGRPGRTRAGTARCG